MGQPAAKAGDRIVAMDTHVVLVPSPPGSPVPTPLPHPFAGVLDGNLSPTVSIMGAKAATVASTATNTPAHAPTPPGVSFQRPPANRGTVQTGSVTVKIGGQGVARNGDTAITCNDPADLPVGTVVAAGTVLVGG